MVRRKVFRQILGPTVKAMSKTDPPVLSESGLSTKQPAQARVITDVTAGDPQESGPKSELGRLENFTDKSLGTAQSTAENASTKQQDTATSSGQVSKCTREFSIDVSVNQAENSTMQQTQNSAFRPPSNHYGFISHYLPFPGMPPGKYVMPQPASSCPPRATFYPAQNPQPLGLVSAMTYSSYSSTQPALKRSRPDDERNDEIEDQNVKPKEYALHAVADVIPRQWEYTEYGRAHLQRPKEGVEFSLLSYNILAQQLLEDNAYLYTHCSQFSLDWEQRKGRLLAEMLAYKPDVLCLQEVEAEHYTDFFLPHLSEAGYSGRFQKRTGNKPDGCAIFVKDRVFEICDTFPVIYNRGDILDRDNVALIVKLKAIQDRDDGKEAEVFIATTHLLFNPGRGDIKLAQLSVLLAELDGLASINSSNSSKYSPIILCGDFNSEPHSDIYKFLVKGYLRFEGLLCRELSGQRERTRRRDVYMTNQLLPPSMKITDQCQYVCNLEKRNIFIPEYISKGVPISKCSIGEPEGEYVNPETPGEQPHGSRDATVDRSFTGNCRSALPSTDTRSSASPSHRNVPEVSQGTGCVWHKLNLVSAYKHTIERLCHSSEEVTTQHQYASCTLDYIFYNVLRKRTHTKKGRVVTRDVEEDKLRLLGRYGLLSSRELFNLGGLPNSYLASDHLGILVQFLLKYSRAGKA